MKLLGKIRYSSTFAVLLTLLGFFVFAFAKNGIELISGYGIFEQILYFVNNFNFLAFLFYFGLILGLILQLFAIKLRHIGFIGSLYLGLIFIPLTLSYYGIDIPTLTTWVLMMMNNCTSDVIIGSIPLYIEFFTFDLGLGSILVAIGSIIGIIGSLLPSKTD